MDAQERRGKEEALRLLRRAKTMVIATQGGSGPWATKVFYALDRGIVFLLEKEGRTLGNVLRDGRASFTVDLDRPDLFLQGEGTVQVLGDPAALGEERGALLYKVKEDALFVHLGHTVIARLIPERVKLSDMRGVPKHYELRFDPDELVEVRRSPLLRATRYWALQMSSASLVVGTLMARSFNPILFVAAAAALFSIHLSFNMYSDYFDFSKGVDTPTSLGSGGSRVLIDGILRPPQFAAFASSLLALGLGIGAYLIYLRPAIVPFVGIGVAAGLLYGVPRISLKDHALGDLAVFLAFGPGIALGAQALQGGSPDAASVLLSFALGFLIVAVLHANNWRDIRTDVASGVRTIASLIGDRLSMAYYLALIWGAYPLTIAAAILMGDPFALAALASAPMAAKLTRVALTQGHFKRWMLDYYTGQLTFTFAVLLAAGLIVGRIV